MCCRIMPIRRRRDRSSRSRNTRMILHRGMSGLSARSVQGIRWGQEMFRWFVAYGVPGKYLQLQLGSGAADQLVLVLVDRG